MEVEAMSAVDSVTHSLKRAEAREKQTEALARTHREAERQRARNRDDSPEMRATREANAAEYRAIFGPEDGDA
jgi:hypothetical protein